MGSSSLIGDDMRLKRVGPIALSVGVVAMLAGCGGSAGGTPAVGYLAAHRVGHSWMAPSSSSQDLLYVTGACGGVCVFAYPSGTLVGELSDSSSPLGECVDKSGDVFVVNFGFEDGTPGVYEYAHGGTSPIAELSDPGYNPESCSVDPTTGNLAVTNDSGGVVAIYFDAKGDPTDYADPKIEYMSFCGYDDKGNLFVDGSTSNDTFELDELPAGSSEFKSIKLTQAASYPGNIQWAGKYLALADSDTVIYHVKVSGRKGIVTGTTVLNVPGTAVDGQFWIQGGMIVSPYVMSERSNLVGLWKYPAGGRIRKSISASDDAELWGAVVSPASSQTETK